jgi:hypothetical protein
MSPGRLGGTSEIHGSPSRGFARREGGSSWVASKMNDGDRNGTDTRHYQNERSNGRHSRTRVSGMARGQRPPPLPAKQNRLGSDSDLDCLAREDDEMPEIMGVPMSNTGQKAHGPGDCRSTGPVGRGPGEPDSNQNQNNQNEHELGPPPNPSGSVECEAVVAQVDSGPATTRNVRSKGESIPTADLLPTSPMKSRPPR